MPKTRCPFCHEWVELSEFERHSRQHRGRRPDGQQQAYVTLPPEEREDGPLDGVPRVYSHERCGARTGMPEEIIRTYLKDPYFYWADRSFCTGCGQHVPFGELAWVETGETLQEYTDRLRAAHPEKRPNLFFRAARRLLLWFSTP